MVAALLSRAWVYPLDTLRVSRALPPTGRPLHVYRGLSIALALSVPGTATFLWIFHALAHHTGSHVAGAVVAEAVAGLWFVPS